MKKIGILTFHYTDNFGAVLQAYALKTKLQNMGADASIIPYTPVHSYLYKAYRVLPDKDTLNRFMEKGFSYMFHQLIMERIRHFIPRVNKKRKFNQFRRKYIKLDPSKIISMKDNALLQYDIYIAGSDQVWNPELTIGMQNTYYLDFVPENKIRASYAASMGISELGKYQEQVAKNLKNLNYISVREKSAIDMLQPLTKTKVVASLDPVFLLDKQEWSVLLDEKKRFKGNFIFFYCLDNNPQAIKLANYLASKYQLPVLHFYFGGLRKKIEMEGKCFYFDGPLDFLWYIQNAKYIVTDSFHAVAFSLIFHKTFYPFLRRGMSSRIKDLLTDLSIEDRLEMYTNYESFDFEQDNIDFDAIQQKISEIRRESISYLEMILS